MFLFALTWGSARQADAQASDMQEAAWRAPFEAILRIAPQG